jgi:hypothetical protein
MKRWLLRTTALTVLVCAVAAVVVGIRVAARGDAEPAAGAPASAVAPSSPAIEASYGIRIERVSLIGDGGIVELRYVLLDADKAGVLHATDQDFTDDFPHIHANGVTIDEPTFHHHGGDLVTGRELSILYGNLDGAVHLGDRVTVTIGDERLDDIPVG